MNAALLLLADSRLPAGGHGHSGGVEEAVRIGAIQDLPGLAAFLRGRLATAGLVTAALAAAACEYAAVPGAFADGAGWARLDAEADARISSPAQREASRTQGRLLLRTSRRIWPSPVLDAQARAVPQGVHHPLALGAVAAVAGCSPAEAALAAAYTSVTAPATAAVRLLGLDPVAVHRLLADLAPALERVSAGVPAAPTLPTGPTGPTGSGGSARRAGSTAPESPGHPEDPEGWEALPAHAAPALDLLAERHVRADLRLFVS
ncbi:urease accessory UreF family protein [Streptosporangium sp. NPDC023615]|uniref:urease accessory protein UreF n=1 Tax=Streptosporangium sp. NPDC023615 TaxID=3154794 RepID=UPI003418D689